MDNKQRDEINAGIKTVLHQLDGTEATAVARVTGLSVEELDDLGGLTEPPL